MGEDTALLVWFIYLTSRLMVGFAKKVELFRKASKQSAIENMTNNISIFSLFFSKNCAILINAGGKLPQKVLSKKLYLFRQFYNLCHMFYRFIFPIITYLARFTFLERWFSAKPHKIKLNFGLISVEFYDIIIKIGWIATK